MRGSPDGAVEPVRYRQEALGLAASVREHLASSLGRPACTGLKKMKIVY